MFAIRCSLPLQPTVGSSITTPENNTSASTYPKAYLHVLLFDERFQFDNVNSVIQQIGAARRYLYTIISKNKITKKREAVIADLIFFLFHLSFNYDQKPAIS